VKGFDVAPLSSGYMLTSIVGFLISVFWVLPKSSKWGFTFLFFFGLMFVASMISMTYAPVDIDYKIKRKK
jgi:multisubunit Na+/H+ antiporter MnhB subunit